VIVSSIEEAILTTLEELAEVVENEEESPVFLKGEEVNNILLGLGSGGGEGSGDEPTNPEVEPSDSKEVEYKEEDNMSNQNLEWMT